MDRIPDTINVNVRKEQPILNLGLPRGEKGEQGIQGPKGIKGDAGAIGPQGVKGDKGEAATISIGSVVTGEYATQASVTNSGTANAAVLNFVIPKGKDGILKFQDLTEEEKHSKAPRVTLVLKEIKATRLSILTLHPHNLQDLKDPKETEARKVLREM